MRISYHLSWTGQIRSFCLLGKGGGFPSQQQRNKTMSHIDARIASTALELVGIILGQYVNGCYADLGCQVILRLMLSGNVRE